MSLETSQEELMTSRKALGAERKPSGKVKELSIKLKKNDNIWQSEFIYGENEEVASRLQSSVESTKSRFLNPSKALDLLVQLRDL